jgi:hypothetical protein
MIKTLQTVQVLICLISDGVSGDIVTVFPPTVGQRKFLERSAPSAQLLREMLSSMAGKFNLIGTPARHTTL